MERLINTVLVAPGRSALLLSAVPVSAFMSVIVIDAVDGFSTRDVSTTNVGAVLPVEICAMREAVIGPFRHSIGALVDVGSWMNSRR